MAEALETLPTLADDVRDHRRQRRLEGPDPRDRRPPRGGAPGRRPGGPPRGQPRLRRCAALGLRGVALRPARVHRRRPPVPDRRPRPADRAARRAGPARRRRGLPDQARRPADPDRLRPHLQARQPDLLRPQGPRRRLRLQAVPARGARRRAGRVRRRVLLRGAADQDPAARPLGRRGRRAALPADGRLARRARSRRSSGGRSRTSGCSACGCGRTPTGPAGAAGRSWATDAGRRVSPTSRRLRPAPAPRVVRVEAVHELAEDVELRRVERLAGRLERGGGPAGFRACPRHSSPSPSSSSSSVPSGMAAAWSRTCGGGEDRALEPDGQRDGVGRPGVDLVAAVRGHDLEPGVERVVGERRDHHPLDARPRARPASSRTGRGSAAAPTRSPGAASRSPVPPTARSRRAGSGRPRPP